MPDEVLPSGLVPFFNKSGDTVSFGVDSYTFGAVPTGGALAFSRVGGAVTNTPTNYAGVTGTVSAAPTSVYPSSVPTTLLMLVAIMSASLVFGRARRDT